MIMYNARWSFLLSPCGNPKQKGKLRALETVIRVIQGFHDEGFLRAWENLDRFSLWLSFLSKCHLIFQTRKMPGMGGAIGVGIALGRTKNMVKKNSLSNLNIDNILILCLRYINHY